MIENQIPNGIDGRGVTGIEHIIDVHAHFRLPTQPVHPHFGVWNEHVAMEFMGSHGIEMQMLSVPVASTPEESREMNNFGASLLAKYHDRFGLIANLPSADIDATIAEIERATNELGADGFTLPSNIKGQYWGSSAYDPIFAELSHKNAGVFQHPASSFDQEFTFLVQIFHLPAPKPSRMVLIR